MARSLPHTDKPVDTIVSIFINHYLSVHMCHQTTALNSGINLWIKFFNNLSLIASFCTIPSSKQQKLEVFHKYLRPTLKKLCEKNPVNFDKYLNQVLASYHGNTQCCHSRNTIFSCLWQRPKPTTTSTSGTNAAFPSLSGLLNLEAHQLALAITEKTLDKNCFRTSQKIMDREPTSFKIGNRANFKNKHQENGISSGDLDTGLFILSMMDTTCTLKIKPQERQGHATSRT